MLTAAVAWLMPPTAPKPVAANDWRVQARARSAAGTQPVPAVIVPNVETAALSPTAPLASAIAAQARASVADAGLAVAHSAGLVVQRGGERAVAALLADDEPTQSPPPPPRQVAPRAQAAALVIDPAEARYRAGYAWARDNDVQDPRDCRPWRRDPASDGCLDFLDDSAGEEPPASGW